MRGRDLRLFYKALFQGFKKGPWPDKVEQFVAFDGQVAYRNTPVIPAEVLSKKQSCFNTVCKVVYEFLLCISGFKGGLMARDGHLSIDFGR